MNKLKVFLVDDHHVVRSGLKALVDNQPDMEVVGEAGDGLAALELIPQQSVDVVVMDVSMPVMGGVEATRRIKSHQPAIKILALTVHEEEGFLEQLIKAGASGYVVKRAVADDLIHAIRTVAKGGAYLDPIVASSVLGGIAKSAVSAKSAREQKLSERESEVLVLVAKGYTGREIATRLDISTKTVETHKARAMEKLELASRAELVGYAIDRGWLSSSGD
jgi:DNA-binding NarL/FixJ family response regulator